MYDGAVSDSCPAADTADLLRWGMGGTVLFERQHRPYLNLTIISREDNTMPGITLLFDQDISDDKVMLTGIGILIDFRCLTIEFV